ncbi:hypothetical protein [Oscillatoria sp. HE19RPO]|nr:hypothetical protein [Oscillatoria sp. HE19RPO]
MATPAGGVTPEDLDPTLALSCFSTRYFPPSILLGYMEWGTVQ